MFHHFLVQISEFFVSQGASASRPNPEDEDGSDDSSHGVLLHNMPGGQRRALRFSIYDDHIMMKVPMAVLYLVAWQDPAKPSEHLNPIVVEVCQAVR